MGLTVTGIKKVKENLARIPKQMQNDLGQAMYEEFNVEMIESMRRTPVEFGVLRASHVLIGPDYDGGDVRVRIEVGGPSVPYAIYVHENLEAYHPIGQAKFLESTIRESQPFMAQRIATRYLKNR